MVPGSLDPTETKQYDETGKPSFRELQIGDALGGRVSSAKGYNSCSEILCVAAMTPWRSLEAPLDEGL